MADIVVVALISACAAVFGGAVTSLAAVLGPRWLATAERRAIEKRERYNERRDAVDGFLSALTDATIDSGSGRESRFRAAHKARHRLLSILEPGESGVQEHTEWLMISVETMNAASAAQLINSQADGLYSWLRGEREPSKLPNGRS